MRASNGVSLPRHASTVSAPATNAAAMARSVANSPASASAVDTCVPLRSARPSFGARSSGCDAARLQRFAARHDAAVHARLAFADQHRSPGAQAARDRPTRRPSPARECRARYPRWRRPRASRSPASARPSSRRRARRPSTRRRAARPRRRAADPCRRCASAPARAAARQDARSSMRVRARRPKPVLTPYTVSPCAITRSTVAADASTPGFAPASTASATGIDHRRRSSASDIAAGAMTTLPSLA